MAKQQNQPFESTLQDLVYSLDAGTGLRIIRVVLFCLFILGLVVIFTARQFVGLNTEAAMDYAQLGRNLAQHNRYVTHCVRPVTIAQVSANTFDGDSLIGFHPELIRPPAYPVIMAGAFKFCDLVGIDLFPNSEGLQGAVAYPAEQRVIIPINHVFAMLTGLLVYLMGRKLFAHKIGLLSVLTYFLSAMVWEDSLMGIGIPVLSFFILGAFYFALLSMIHRREQRPASNWMVLYLISIGCGAAAFLTNYATVAVLPGLALFILLMGTRTHRNGHLAFFYLVLVLAAVSPWIIRNYQVAGSPLGLAPHTALIETAKYPGDALMRTLNPDFSLFRDFAAVRAKWSANFSELYTNHFTSLGGGLLVTFFVVTFFYRFIRVHVHNLRWGVGLAMVLFFVGAGCFTESAYRLYHIFWPFVILYGIAFFFILLDRLDVSINLYKQALTGLVIGLTALPLLVTIFLSPAPRTTYPPYHVPFIMRVSELLKPTEIMCSDMPWATAWYGKRVSILLPQTLDDFYDITDFQGKYISGLYLTTLTKDKPFVSSLFSGSEKSWFPITMGQLPKDFPLRQGFQLNENDQLFLTDSIRWGAGTVQSSEGDAE
jgi:hypothetical protein